MIAKPDFAAQVSAELLAILSDTPTTGTGEPAWQRPWFSGASGINAVTGKPYRGMNRVLAQAAVRNRGEQPLAPYLATAKQWETLGAKVIPGNRGYSLCAFSVRRVTDLATGKVRTQAMGSHFQAYLPEQTTATPLIIHKAIVKHGGSLVAAAHNRSCDAADAVRSLPGASTCRISRGGNQPAYRPDEDSVLMPMAEQFFDDLDHAATLAHELIHWTGHKNRLNRVLRTQRFSTDYAIEELIAECGAAMVLADLGIAHRPTSQCRAYLAAWRRAARDKACAVMVIREATKAAAFLRGV